MATETPHPLKGSAPEDDRRVDRGHLPADSNAAARQSACVPTKTRAVSVGVTIIAMSSRDRTGARPIRQRRPTPETEGRGVSGLLGDDAVDGQVAAPERLTVPNSDRCSVVDASSVCATTTAPTTAPSVTVRNS